MKRPLIFVSWLGVFAGLGGGLSYVHGQKGAETALTTVVLLWCGMLIAISLTEAWVKFKTKLLERHVAFDVGRNVFDALNSLELAVACTLVGLKVAFPHVDFPPALIACLGMLAVQVVYLTPKLELRAVHAMCELLANRKHATKVEEESFKEFRAITALSSNPSSTLHVVYVVFEFVKVALLLSVGVVVK
ncbi:hypothetical protein BASA81_002962 [Batrachochytrium salamandrivorans]|nr:hypothetical protein BASA81_002962 [Batrachochytrium salamandrivorans]